GPQNGVPNRGPTMMLPPCLCEMTFEEPGHVCGDPGRHVNTVCDRVDRAPAFWNAGPHLGPHFPRDLSVDLTHGIGRARATNRQSCHIEHRPAAAIVLSK